MGLFIFVSGSSLHHAIHVALQWKCLLNINSRATDGFRCALITNLFCLWNYSSIYVLPA